MSRPALIDALLERGVFGHPVDSIRVVETHISFVLLTGRYAYKIKKPVDLGFLDFSTLERRKHFCEEELRLNKRLAPDLYVDVVPICGSVDAPVLGGEDAPLEYCVRMRQFDTRQEIDRLLAEEAVTAPHFDRLAADLAAFHDAVDVAGPDSEFGDRASLRRQVMDNFDQCEPCRARLEVPQRFERLRAWSEASLERLDDRFGERKRDGHVRECHGDLHAANMVLVDGRIVAFDCLEFSPRLRWIDTMSEIAFVLMDLDFRARPDLARRFLNRYLEHGGDYAGLSVLRHYLAYRAMVRAKVACIRLRQEGAGEGERAHALAEFRDHVGLAARYAERPPSPWLAVTHGLSGSGKTFVTDAVLERIDAVRVRSDVERKRLHGLAPAQRSGSGLDEGLYRRQASAATYERLERVAEQIVLAGYPAIVDATFLERAQRHAMRRLAERLGVPFVILEFVAPYEVLARRVGARLAGTADASEATLEVLARQRDRDEALDAGERALALEIEAGAEADADAIAQRLGALR